MNSKLVLFILVLILGFFLRFYQLDNIPPAIDSDEASLGYDAYSILKTGKDRYGEFLPIFFRSFGNYQSPLYVYLSVIPIALLDLSVFATRLVSAISGVVILICTFLILLHLNHPKRFQIAILSTLLLSISPWAILFSRTAVEANLGLAIFVFSILLFVRYLKKLNWLFILACIFLALSTYAYHAERVISLLFLTLFIIFFRQELFKSKKILILGILLFFIIQIPQFIHINSPAFKSRLDKVQYTEEEYKKNKLNNFPFGIQLSILRKFSAQYVTYFSPKNLFFDADEQPIRSMPDLSTFYPWMIIPFILGISLLMKERSSQIIKILILVLIISPIPAAVTREPFYTLRALPLFWVLTIINGFGMSVLLHRIRQLYLKIIVVTLLVLISLILLYNSYFILLKHERMESFGKFNLELINKLESYKNNRIVIDASRMNVGIWFFFEKKYDPNYLQQKLKHYVTQGYYSSEEFDEKYEIDNIVIRLNPFEDSCKGDIIVGDSLTIADSDSLIVGGKLQPVFEIKNQKEDIVFKAFYLNEDIKC